MLSDGSVRIRTSGPSLHSCRWRCQVAAIHGARSPNDPCFIAGTDGSNPLSSTGESTNHRFRRRFHGLVVGVAGSADEPFNFPRPGGAALRDSDDRDHLPPAGSPERTTGRVERLPGRSTAAARSSVNSATGQAASNSTLLTSPATRRTAAKVRGFSRPAPLWIGETD
jgi:hypothetical protein